MATVDKAFRIKNGLVVEGSSATVNGSNVLTEASTEFLQDTTAAMFTNGTHTDISFTYDDSTGVINAAVSSTPTFADRINFEGLTPDSYELTLLALEPIADVTVTLPNATTTLIGDNTTNTLENKTFDTAGTGNVFKVQGNSITSYSGTGGTVVLNNTPTISSLYVNSGLNLNGSTTGHTQLLASSTAGGVITFPAVTGNVVTTGDTGTVTNTMLAGSIENNKLSNSAITINGVSTSLGGTRTLVTDDIAEAVTSPTNLWFTAERAQDAIGTLITNGTQTNITVTYDDANAALNFNATGGVASLSGTANEVEVTNVGTAYTVGLPNNITVAGNITINGTPTQSTHAATVGYVDSIAQGLHIHASVVAASTTSLLAFYNNGTAGVGATLTNGDITNQQPLQLDGVYPNVGDRVLIKNQLPPMDAPQNGIYVVTDTGSTTSDWVLTRASDFNTNSEIQGGDFVFVTGGTYNDNTGWVQTDKVTTVGTDPILFLQFSGAGTYNAGNGLTLLGNVFSIDTGVTVDLNTAQTLTNKTLTSPVLNTPSISGPLVLGNNIVIEGTDDTHETTLTFTDPTQDNTITFKDASGTVAFTSDVESAIDGFGNAVTGSTGISVAYASTSNVLTITNVGVTSLAGTTDQVTVSGSTGSVTLSLPQSIASTSSPTFAGVSVGSGSLTAGSVILTDALLGTATTSIAGTSATVVDSWSATTYSSAKYIVQMKNGNDIEVLEVLITIDGNNNVYLTEYADIQSNIQLGTTDADYLSGNVRLLVTSTNGTTVKVHKTLIEA